MPRNGSGLYILPAGNPVVTQTVIKSSWANPTMADVAIALTNSIAKDGQTTPTNDLPMGGFRHTSVGLATARTQYARVDQVQNGTLLRCTAEAGGDAYTGLLPFGQTVFVNGQQITYKFPATNTTATPTLNINASAPWPILRQDGSSVLPGDCKTTVPSLLVFNDTSWLLINAGGSGGGGGGVSSFNTRTGPVTLLQADVTAALGYTPINKAGDVFTGAVTLAGDAASALQPVTLQQMLAAVVPAVAGVASFNTRTGPVVLTSADVTGALGYVPVQTFNGRTGPVTATAADIVGALGYVPLNKAGDAMGGNLSLGGYALFGAASIAFAGINDNGASGVAKTIPFPNANYQKMLMTGNCVITFTPPYGPCVVQLELTQDATGSRTMTLPATVKWPAAYAAADKTLTTAANARDLLILKYNGTDYVANLVKGIA